MIHQMRPSLPSAFTPKLRKTRSSRIPVSLNYCLVKKDKPMKLKFLPLILTLAIAATLPLWAQAAAPAPTAAAAASPDIGGPDAAWRDKSKTPDQRAKDIL